MMTQPYQPAPYAEMVRYLAVLHRALHSIARRGSQDSVSGLLFTGWLADALHNVPGILWCWDEENWWPPSRVGAWVSEGFISDMEHHGATPNLLDEARVVVTAHEDAAALGLRNESSLAPQADLEHYLDLLTNFLLDVRGIRNYARTRADPPRALLGTAVVNKQELRDTGKANGTAASILREIPAALVAWERFDEPGFVERALTRIEMVPSGYANYLRHAITARKKKSA